MKVNVITLIVVFSVMQLVIALDFPQSEIMQTSIVEINSTPLKFEGKVIRIIGWLNADCYHGLKYIEDGDEALSISSSNTEPSILVQKDDLYKELWMTCPDRNQHNPCRKDFEVELEGFLRDTKTLKEFSSLYVPVNRLPGRLIVTRVIRIEEKYRTPPVGICVPEEPENVVPPTIPDWIKPERNELNFFEGIRDTKAE